MTLEEQQKEQVIQNIVDLLRQVPFTFEFKVKRKPAGVKVIWEVTQEHMNAIIGKIEDEYDRQRENPPRD